MTACRIARSTRTARLALLLAAGAAAAIGQPAAALPRSFVSGSGNDANACTRDLPCRSFDRAMLVTAAGGEVIALDTAGYGPMTITKSVSVISPPGIVAAISNGVASPLGVNAGVSVVAGPNDRVILRGLNINIQSGPTSGVAIASAGTVHIEASSIKGATTDFGAGVYANPSSTLRLHLRDVGIRNFGIGVWLRGDSARIDATGDRVRVQDTYDGVGVLRNTKAVFRDSVSSGNVATGFYLYNDSVANVSSLVLERCTASNNGTVGVLADPASVTNGLLATGLVTVSNCTITNNGTGLQSAAAGNPPLNLRAAMSTRGNNTVRENGVNQTGTLFNDTPL